MRAEQKRSIEIDVHNTDRAVGTLFGAEITRRYADNLDEDTFTVKCNGSGGQSFGAFIPKGLTLELVGDSNDYFGKGLSGGKLLYILRQVHSSRKMRILSSVMLHFMVLQAVKHL